MKTQRTLIAMCIATLFASNAALAKDKWDYHEGAWDSAKSYGNVTIAKDSVQQWGPWEDFVEPAAGGPSVGFLASSSDPYRPLPQPIPVTGCGDGEWCGYMAVAVDDWKNYKYKNRRDDYPVYVGVEGKRPYMGQFDPVNIALQFEKPEGGWFGFGGVNLVLTSDLISGGEFGAAAGTSSGMVPTLFFGRQGLFTGVDGSFWDEYIYLKSGFDDGNNNKYATMGLLKARLENYVGGDGAYFYESDDEYVYVYAPFVAGQLTSLDDMRALNLGRFKATYEGKTFLAGGDVTMNVNFETAKWGGSWNGGSGPTGFIVKQDMGNISGANFSASGSSLGVNGECAPSISGTVNGSFYGPSAAAAGGIVDVMKTPNGESAKSTRYVDVFLANKTSQYVSPPVTTISTTAPQ